MVNEYLRQTTNEDITAKDFRTWPGTVYSGQQLRACGEPATETRAKRNIVAAVKAVAELLGNRPATCRKYYVHSLVLELYVAAPAERCVLQILLAKSSKPSRSLRLRAK